MTGKHIYDPEFSNCSGELKQVLANNSAINFNYCLDIPCGNGRNIFLLAAHFKQVVGVDLNDLFLSDINAMAPRYGYNDHNISTKKIDITNEIPDDIYRFDFITVIHFYSYSFLSRIIDCIKNGALVYIETQGCAGGNFKELPVENEVKFLFRDTDLLMFKHHICPSSSNEIKSIAFKALIKKRP